MMERNEILQDEALKKQMEKDKLDVEDIEMLISYGGKKIKEIHQGLGTIELEHKARVYSLLNENAKIRKKLSIYEIGVRKSFFGILIVFFSGVFGWFFSEKIFHYYTYYLGGNIKTLMSLILSTFSLALISFYDIGRIFKEKKEGQAYKKDRKENLKKKIDKIIGEKPKDEEGEWIETKKIAQKVDEDARFVGKILKEKGFLQKRDSKNRYFFVKKSVFQ